MRTLILLLFGGLAMPGWELDLGQGLSQVIGSAEERAALQVLISDCRGEPQEFRWQAFQAVNIPIKLVQAEGGKVYANGAFRNKGQKVPHLIALAHINAHPLVQKEPDGLSYPRGVPEWATTRCMALAHEIAEATYAHENDAGYDASHAYAVAVENRIRREFGNSQCRSRNPTGQEAKDVPHTDHTDFVVRIGNHTERGHRREKNEVIDLTISWEIGLDKKCHPSSYDYN